MLRNRWLLVVLTAYVEPACACNAICANAVTSRRVAGQGAPETEVPVKAIPKPLLRLESLAEDLGDEVAKGNWMAARSALEKADKIWAKAKVAVVVSPFNSGGGFHGDSGIGVGEIPVWRG